MRLQLLARMNGHVTYQAMRSSLQVGCEQTFKGLSFGANNVIRKQMRTVDRPVQLRQRGGGILFEE